LQRGNEGLGVFLKNTNFVTSCLLGACLNSFGDGTRKGLSFVCHCKLFVPGSIYVSFVESQTIFGRNVHRVTNVTRIYFSGCIEPRYTPGTRLFFLDDICQDILAIGPLL
jgi:hypothetical protein